MSKKQGWVDFDPVEKIQKLKNGYAFTKKGFNLKGKKIASESEGNSSGSKQVSPVSSFNEIESDKKHEKQYFDFKKNERIETCAKVIFYISIVLLPIATVLIIIGMVTPFWFTTDTGSFGLFQICTTYPSSCDDITSFITSSVNNLSSTWYMVIGLDAAGIFILLASLILITCTYLHLDEGQNKTTACGILIAVAIFLGAAAILSGTAIMILYNNSQNQYNLSWSFYISTSGGVIAFMSCVLYLMYICTIVVK